MLSCSRVETKYITEGTATSITRMWADPMPYAVGGEVILSSRFVGNGERELPFAKGVIVSVRPVTVGEMRRSERLCQMDGFSNSSDWHAHLCTRYPGTEDYMRMVRLQLKIEDMDKTGGERAADQPDRMEIDREIVGDID